MKSPINEYCEIIIKPIEKKVKQEELKLSKMKFFKSVQLKEVKWWNEFLFKRYEFLENMLLKEENLFIEKK